MNTDRETNDTPKGDLRSRFRGPLLRLGDEGYREARAAWNLNAQQWPAAVVVAEDASDVVAAVRFARAERLGVGVMATGHGTAAPCHGGVLVNTSRMTDVRIDPVMRTARVGAGTKWGDVVRAAAPHRLAGLPGSSSQVGVVGYLMGGGFGWLGRKYGFAASSLIQAEVVTADGELVQASAHHNADLFWGLKGGSGNFGIVTAAEFALHPVENVYAGNLFYPVERARDVLTRYGSWSRSLPDEMMTAVAFRRFPPMPTVPEPLRGRTFAAVRACYCGEDLAEGERLVKPLREALGEPETDTFAIMPVTDMDSISMDPVQPIGAFQHMEMLRDLTPAAIETLVGLGTASPLIMLEARQLGGALSGSAAELSPIGHSNARFSLNAVGPTPTPEAGRLVRSFLNYLTEAVRPHVTGTTYLNFLELDEATPDRVRAAYSPADWARLVDLKYRYDPHNLFRFNRNIPPAGLAQGGSR